MPGTYRKKRRIRKRSKRFIRRTGRLRNKGRYAKTASRRFRKSIMPTKRGPYTKSSEIKFVDIQETNKDLWLYYGAAIATPGHFVTVLNAADPNSFVIQQGSGRSQFNGQKINLISMDLTFKVEIFKHYNVLNNNNNYPVDAAESLVFTNNLSNFQPTIRIATMWDKRSKQPEGDTPASIGTPLQSQGFQAPYDIAFYKMVEDKTFKLRMIGAMTGITPVMQTNTPVICKYFKKTFPLKMTADMELIDPETNTYGVNILKRLYVCLTHDAPWSKTLDGQAMSHLRISEINSRLWFKDP